MTIKTENVSFVIAIATLSLAFNSLAADSDDDKRRQKLAAIAKMEFEGSTNHCLSFAKIAEEAAKMAPNAGSWLEDMRLVIIGQDLARVERGKYHLGVKTGDSGFKPELKDGSSQVEHAMAAVYFGKALPPMATTLGGSLKEMKDAYKRNEVVSAADIALWAIGEDIGARLSNGNLTEVGRPIRRTMCE